MFSPSGGSLSNKGQNRTSMSDALKDSNVTIDTEVYQTEGINDVSQSISDVSSKMGDRLVMETVDFDDMIDPTKLNIPEGDWMFGDEAKSTVQYGGDQRRLKDAFELYAKDPKTMEIINKYYQDVDMEDLQLLFDKMENVGCGYMAVVDTIFAEYGNKSPEEFSKKFGFDPTIVRHNNTLDKDVTFYNYDYLFLDFFLYHAKTKGYTTIEEVYGNIEEITALGDQETDVQIEETGMDGTYESEVAKIFTNYLNEKGIEVKTITSDDFDAHNLKLDSNTINNLLRNGSKIVVGGEDFALYEPTDINDNGHLDDVYAGNVAPHTMYLVGTTNDPEKIVVSSWGEEYVMNLADITDFVVYDYN
ncbi:MAG: hypothetical protein IKE63_05705 [Bacilli bacterium]|nr:hypothetical protein [Bacilli bacterium]